VPHPHGEEAPTGLREARPDEKLSAVSNHEAVIVRHRSLILRDAREMRAPQDEEGEDCATKKGRRMASLFDFTSVRSRVNQIAAAAQFGCGTMRM
jgi:hypothetical protein